MFFVSGEGQALVKCKAKTKAGNPCQANAAAGSDYCITHTKLYGAKAPEAQAIEKDLQVDSMAEMPAAPPHAAEAIAQKHEPQKAASTQEAPKYVKETPIVASPVREKEDTRMDEKKNVGFVPGLALLLAILALVLIAINAVNPTPTMEVLEKSMDTKIEAQANSLLMMVKNGDLIGNKIADQMLVRDLDNLSGSLANYGTKADKDLKAEIEALQVSVNALKAKIMQHGTVVDPAPVKAEEEAPAPAPAEAAPAK